MKLTMYRFLTASILSAGVFAATSAFAESPAPITKPEVKIDSADLTRSPGAITSFAPIVEKVSPSVVTVFTSKPVTRDLRALPPALRRFFGVPGQGGNGEAELGRVQGLGSGVVVSADGHILTNNHVIDGADEIMVTLGMDRKEYKAKKIGTDPATDLAVLKIEANEELHPVTFADSSRVRPGDVVLAVGNPFGLRQSVSMGIVSAIGRGDVGITDYENFIQTDAAINMGNSGGALVDAAGRLVGINTAIFSRTGGSQGIGFAIPANLARTVMNSIIDKGHVVRGYIGVLVQPLTDKLAEAFKIKDSTGALVAEVTPDGPASKAGVMSGDIIKEVNGKPIADARDLQMTIAATEPGSAVALTVIRDGQGRKIDVKLGELPAKEGQAAAESASKSNALDGIAVGDIDGDARTKYNLPDGTTGVVITSIDPGSAGYEAGLREGDVIQEMNRKELTGMNQAIDLSNQIEKDETVLLRVLSKGKSRYVVVKPAEQ